MNKRTPGPWSGRQCIELASTAYPQTGPSIVMLMYCDVGDKRWVEAHANYRLAMASSDMLEALRKCRTAALPTEVRELVDAAISKAEGRS